MNILYLNHNVVWRSTFHRCFLYARELSRLGHTVTIITNSPSSKTRFREYSIDGVRIIESPDILWGSLRTGWDPLNVVRRCIYIRNKQYDLLHAFDTRPTVILPALFYQKFIRRVPLVIDWADWWGRGGAIDQRSHKLLNTLFRPVETFFEEYFRRYANKTTVISVLLKKRVLQLGIQKKDLTLIPNGIDTRSIYPIDRAKARKALHISQKAKVCVFSGYVLYDIHLILEAFKMIEEKEKNALLLLLGDFKESAIRKEVQNNSRIRFVHVTSREKLRTFLSASDVALLPLANTLANRARFPMKIGDYIAAGIPFLTSDVGEVGAFCKTHAVGIFVKNTPKDLTRGVLAVFSRPPPKIYAVNARVCTEFSYKKLVNKLHYLYAHVSDE